MAREDRREDIVHDNEDRRRFVVSRIIRHTRELEQRNVKRAGMELSKMFV
jgi:hypothetical protein